MNKIYKVMYSKVKQCCVVVSEIAKSHGRHTKRSVAKSSAALTAGVLIALGSFSFEGMPVVQAADGTESLKNNDYVGANGYYWYFDEKTNQWTKYPYKISSLNNNRSWQELPNYEGGGAKEPGAVTAGLYAQAGEQTVTIGNRNAGQSKGSVFIGELDGYNDGGKNDPVGMKNNYVTAVGFQSNATGWGSIAIGSNAVAENTRETSQVVDYDGNKGTSGTVQDDNYGIKLNPPITWSSVALGYNAKAKDGNIAIGANSDATSTDKGDSYVSVGNGTLKRRITNVAKGTDNSDVVTVGQMNDAIAQTGGSVKAGWGITKSNDNTISVKHNLSTGDSAYAAVAYADSEATGLILGGSIQDRNADEKYGATTETSVIVGARNALASNDNTVVIGGDNNIASRRGSTVVGGSSNTASGQGYSEAASVFGGSFNISNGLASVVLGGVGNVANNEYSTNSGGAKNVVFGLGSNNSGGLKNVVYASDNASSFGGVAAAVNGQYSTGVAGGSTGSNARLSFAAGFQSLVTDSGVRKTVITRDEYERKWSEQTREFGPVQARFNPITNKYEQDDKISTALGYQATADEPGTIAFGHDAGDESGYTYEWETLTDEKGNPKQNEIDGTTNDYTKAPKSVKKKAPYTSAYYNRLVKAADGIEDHDAVVMEQLKNASDVGSKIKVYQTDENGNIKFDKNNNPIEDTSDSDAVKTKREAAQKASEDAWGKAIGTGKIADPTKSDTNDPEANGSQQLVTGGTVYDALQKQKTELTDSLSVNAGWGIDIDKAKKNTISVKHNLGTGYADTDATGLILGGSLQNRDAAKEYGTATASSVIVGAQNALASNDNSVVVGGLDNVASGATSVVIGGDNNNAAGNQSAVFGGRDNKAAGVASTASGGIMNAAVGQQATAIGGSQNYVLGANATAVGGLGRDYANGEVVYDSAVRGGSSVGIAGGSTGENAIGALAAGHQAVVTTENGTAIGYQATTDEANTIAFGHDAGDVSGYTIKWKQLPPNQINADGTTNDYTQAPESVTENKYTTAAYNRLVKVADGQDDHDVVVMEQLKQYAEKDASNLGNNIKVYKTDEKGNVQLDKDKKPVKDEAATTTAQKKSKDDWGKALGADPFTAGTATTATNASTSDQLVTGKTLYNYDKPTGSTNYVKVNNTTGQNLSALDAQVADNASKLNDKTHNIKYYSVSDNAPTLGFDSYSNAGNDGAKGRGSLAAGFVTHADGIASTVAGSYSGVINSGNVQGLDLRGAAALSYGTFNVNQNTDTAKEHSGVANSIVGQANMTTNSNAAIIYGAGNTVTDSYRPIVSKKDADILGSISDPTKLSEAMQKAVKDSGGQVMVMGGGNTVDKAYMTQVTGVGNTVKGNQVESKGEWVTDTSNTAIKYDPEKSSQYNYVDGFSNEVINGKHDYVIGANNKLSGDSYDDDKAQPIKRSNKSNIVFGDNHTLTNTKNAVIIGSSDTQMILDKGDNATAIGHNASAQRDALAVGVNTEAGGNAVALGTSTIAHNNSIAIGTKATAVSSQNLAIGWEAHIGNIKTDNEKIKNAVALGSDSQVKVNDLLESDNNRGVLSIGDKDKERRIIHVRAGVNDTDAVNVSQLKSAQSDLTGKGLKFAANSGNEYTAKLGTTVKVLGTAKTEGHEYTADNLTTEIDKDGNITILMDKNVSAEKIAVNGKDGENGKPGTAGSIGISGQDGKAGVGIDGKDGISIKGQNGKDGVTIKGIDGVDGVDGAEGHIGLNGKDGMTDIFTTAGTPGLDGKDGETMTRIVYKDPKGTEHEAATLDDGLKFKGDDGKEIAKKLNNTLDIIGGAKGDLTEGNIGVNSTDKGQLKVQLAKDLKGITSISNQKTEGGKTTGAKVTLGADGSVDVNGGKITHVGSGADASGNYTTTTNAANIGDVQKIVKDAVDSAADTTNKALAGKANVDASNIGANLKGADGKAASAEAQKANAEKWGSAIGTGEIKADDGRMVTGKTVYDEVRPKVDGSYVKKDKTTGENLSALDSKIGSMDKDGNYIKKDDSISENLSTLDTQVKKNADDITNINQSISTLDQNAVKYDDSNKSKVTLAGKEGTTITNVKDGALSENSSDAVNGKQLYAEQQAREKADAEINQKVTNNTNEITKIKNGDFTDASKTAIHNIAKNAVKVVDGKNTTVTTVDGTDTTPTTYAVNVEGTGEVASGDKGLISGDTIYNELRPSADGSYIKKDSTTAQNLVSLDTQVKKTSDLINSDGKTIKIGGSDAATKIDVNGKDGKGRVITGVVSDANDPTSAANVGYVNNAYGRLNNNINKAAAGSNALAALHPLDYDPDDKADFAVGYGHYRNANAAAVGAFYHPNENTMVNVGVSLGNGDPGFNAGVSFKVGRGGAGHEAMSKTEMAKVINSQSKEIDALKKDNADKDKRIDALEQKMAEILAKLDKNGK